MKVNRKTLLRNIVLKPSRHRVFIHRIEQEEDPELTVAQKVVLQNMLVEGVFLPVLRGMVGIREVLTPAGGWERFEAMHPNLRELPVEKQMALVLYES